MAAPCDRHFQGSTVVRDSGPLRRFGNMGGQQLGARMDLKTFVNGGDMVVDGMRAEMKPGSNFFLGRSFQDLGEDAVLCWCQASFGLIGFALRRFLFRSAPFGFRSIFPHEDENNVPETQVLPRSNRHSSAKNSFAVNPATVSATEVGYPYSALRDGKLCVTAGDTSLLDDQIALRGAPDYPDAGLEQKILTKKTWRNGT
jgi:hypothetical protein